MSFVVEVVTCSSTKASWSLRTSVDLPEADPPATPIIVVEMVELIGMKDITGREIDGVYSRGEKMPIAS